MQRMNRHANARWSQAGFGLVEVLVAMLVLAIGLLGLAGLQMRSMQATDDASQMATANRLSEDIIERIRANRGAAISGDYDLSFGDDPGVPKKPTVAQEDVGAWVDRVRDELPGAAGSQCGGEDADCGARVEVSGTGRVTVEIRWFSDRRENAKEVEFETESHL